MLGMQQAELETTQTVTSKLQVICIAGASQRYLDFRK